MAVTKSVYFRFLYFYITLKIQLGLCIFIQWSVSNVQQFLKVKITVVPSTVYVVKYGPVYQQV